MYGIEKKKFYSNSNDKSHYLQYYAWEDLQKVLSKNLFKKLKEWLFGMASLPEGPYCWDVDYWWDYNKDKSKPKGLK